MMFLAVDSEKRVSMAGKTGEQARQEEHTLEPGQT